MPRRRVTSIPPTRIGFHRVGTTDVVNFVYYDKQNQRHFERLSKETFATISQNVLNVLQSFTAERHRVSPAHEAIWHPGR